MSDADGADWPPMRKAPLPVPVVNVGDRVRVTVEGTVLAVTPPGAGRSIGRGSLLIDRDDGRKGSYFYGPGFHTEIEVLTPAYVDGGIYKDTDGKVWRYVRKINFMDHDRDGGHWEAFGRLGYYSLGTPARPLTRIDA